MFNKYAILYKSKEDTLIRDYDNIAAAILAAAEGRRDGFKTYLLRQDGTHKFNYNKICELD